MTELTGAQPSDAAIAAGQAMWEDGWTLNVLGPLATYVTTLTDSNGSVAAIVETGPFGVRTRIHGARRLSGGWDLRNPQWRVEAGQLPATLIEAVLRVGAEVEFVESSPLSVAETAEPLERAGWIKDHRLVGNELVPRGWHTEDYMREVRWHDGVISATDDVGWRIDRNGIAGTVRASHSTPPTVIAALALIDF